MDEYYLRIRNLDTHQICGLLRGWES